MHYKYLLKSIRVVDSKIGLDTDVSIRCSGVYSYRISDPLLFYTRVCGNVAESYTGDTLDSQLKAEFISALQPAPSPASVQNSWKCSCGATATGKFCPECGSPKPVDTDGWTCSCGTVNNGKFCPECGVYLR